MFLLSDRSGINVRDKLHCRRCGKKFQYGDRMVPVWIAAGTKDKDLLLLSRRDIQAPQNEFMHRYCDDPQHDKASKIHRLNIRVPAVTTNLPYIEPRGDNAHCVHCNKVYAPGDRLHFVYVCQGIENDPETNTPAAKICGEFEAGHCDCDDPKLDRGRSIIDR